MCVNYTMLEQNCQLLTILSQDKLQYCAHITHMHVNTHVHNGEPPTPTKMGGVPETWLSTFGHFKDHSTFTFRVRFLIKNIQYKPCNQISP